ncbi:GNAT family N-acetyltransferase [Sulfobacillus thermosulfidooxidans]|uniref:GNAT family N-acetyltransferase n=1 Tax=Sulfobacillus thermosulfidooxidans TaxID=28034 RepID=UPI0006B5AA57|nr:GNAT family protein [Sulfobacillus thermosulfidooxidans]
MQWIRYFYHDLYALRPLLPSDASQRLAFFLKNRSFLEPYMPLLHESEFTLAHQLEVLTKGYRDMQEDRRYLLGIFPAGDLDEGPLLGYVNLNNVIRGVFHNCDMGYAIDYDLRNQGVMTAAVKEAIDFAFNDINLHRIQVAIIPTNTPSLRVAEKTGFRLIGLSPQYLKIHGVWQDHLLLAQVCPEIQPY